MAETFFNHLVGKKASASSAGTQPASKINPTVVQVMREASLDISHQKPKLLTFKMMENTNRVITMGCGVEDTCPAGIIPMEDWGIEDPEGKPVDEVRKIRDIIRIKVATLIKELDTEGSFRIERG
ncbi:MAG: arsenate reductase [Chloroflexi bacterium RBG_13_51_18]|nr:MAG: arsenate reductase [Chloroflexi bacterium RBG_13_51_18]